jgi:hypothetical protein
MTSTPRLGELDRPRLAVVAPAQAFDEELEEGGREFGGSFSLSSPGLKRRICIADQTMWTQYRSSLWSFRQASWIAEIDPVSRMPTSPAAEV